MLKNRMLLRSIWLLILAHMLRPDAPISHWSHAAIGLVGLCVRILAIVMLVISERMED